jgi:RNase P/RNase MRP subunit p29
MPFMNHYSKKKITEINPEVDLKIKILGFVVDKKENTFVIDDGSGKVKVFVDEASLLENININQLIRVFGSTLPTEDGYEIKADAMQDLSNLNINLYKKVEELYNKVGV